ncbi:MAG: glycosyltransferase family 9 protein [Synergistaceae bacterium]|jgi:ADP-heptose:LPS heptosyltransferase|nr:glycosyltransferase family 9 protein [Synergistaceae bacterium]
MGVARPQPGDRVLWIRFSAFGDVLRAAAAAHRFTLKFPGVRITFLTRPEYGPLLQNQPYIDNLLFWNVKKHPLDFPKVLSQIRKLNCRYLVSLHRGSAAAFISLFSGIPLRLGYNSGLQFAYTTTHWEYLDALGVDFTSRDEPSIFAAPADLQRARSLLAPLLPRRLFAVIGASKPQKFWPIPHWIAFLKPLIDEGWGIVLNGHGPDEARTAEKIEEGLEKSSQVLNLVGQTPFPLMAAIARECTVAVGNDTGPLHLASLTGTPTLGFFGVTDAWEMNFRMPWFREVRVTCPKAGCRDYRCPLDCLADIAPDRALAEFHRMTEDLHRP